MFKLNPQPVVSDIIFQNTAAFKFEFVLNSGNSDYQDNIVILVQVRRGDGGPDECILLDFKETF